MYAHLCGTPGVVCFYVHEQIKMERTKYASNNWIQLSFALKLDQLRRWALFIVSLKNVAKRTAPIS